MDFKILKIMVYTGALSHLECSLKMPENQDAIYKYKNFVLPHIQSQRSVSESSSSSSISMAHSSLSSLSSSSSSSKRKCADPTASLDAPSKRRKVDESHQSSQFSHRTIKLCNIAGISQKKLKALSQPTPANSRRAAPTEFHRETAVANNEEMAFVSKNSRTKVFSGNVEDNLNLCNGAKLTVNEAKKNLEALKLPINRSYVELLPSLRFAKPDQLSQIESANPQLLEHTSGLWENFARKDFAREQRQRDETWKEMYKRCEHQQQSKFKKLTEAITKRNQFSNGRPQQAQVLDKTDRPKVISKSVEAKLTCERTSPTEEALKPAIRGVFKRKAAPLMAKTLSQLSRR